MLDHAPKDCGTSTAGPTEFAVAHPPPSFRMQCFKDRWTLPNKSFSELPSRRALRSAPSTWHRYTWAYIGTCTCGKIVAAAVTVAFQLLQLLSLASETFPLAGQHSDTRECTAETKRSVASAISSTLHYRTAVERPNTPPSKKRHPILRGGPSQSGFLSYLRGGGRMGRGLSH